MDVTLLKKLQAFILIVLMIPLCASAGLFTKDIHVHMTNNLGVGTILYLHCLRNSKEMGHQQRMEFSTLVCEANLKGAKQLKFVAYNKSEDLCRDSCGWKFTQHGAFQFENGEWIFRYTWRH
ncbi:hypothetical protein PVL29_013779 [Vitis rotundifolia]|uniref:S-protein homolog n=1 Tax=Vitis rotundifolia TaxID=103349 RepID=A0AA38ZMS8_VITRO|nr:hypothetical protein PVL29_013779 [Vitis rotundifolia]